MRFAFLIWAVFSQLTLSLSANVLLFTIDSCRADRFGVYGHDKGTTPNIDAWAKTGTVFTNAYSTSAWTAPGLASILTGLYPPTHGINNRDRTGSKRLITLATLFERERYLIPSLNFFTFAPYYRNLGLGDVERVYFSSSEESPVINWLKEYTSKGSKEPFFLWFHTTIVHQPYRPQNLPDELEVLERSPGIKAVLNGAIVPKGSVEFQKSDQVVLDQLYNEEIRRADRLFGEILNILEEHNLIESTLIVLTADHGEELLDHGFVGHASTSLNAKLYEELIHIPLIMSWPNHISKESRKETLASQIDILPTIANLKGIRATEHVQGVDLFKDEADRPLFFESVIAGNQTPKDREGEWLRAIRKGNYKYISTGELYNLRSDPNENSDLAAKQPDVVSKLSQELANWLKSSSELGQRIFPPDNIYSGQPTSECPHIYTPEHKLALDYDAHTGALLFDWSGDMETSYLLEYDIGTGDYHVEGTYEVDGNHQILGPFPKELWTNLKAWNPFRIRVSPKSSEPCWSAWVEFRF